MSDLRTLAEAATPGPWASAHGADDWRVVVAARRSLRVPLPEGGTAMTLRDALSSALYLVAQDESDNPTLDLTDTAERVLSDPAFRAGLIRAVEEAIEGAHLDVISYKDDPHGWTLTDHFAAVKIVEGVLG